MKSSGSSDSRQSRSGAQPTGHYKLRPVYQFEFERRDGRRRVRGPATNYVYRASLITRRLEHLRASLSSLSLSLSSTSSSATASPCLVEKDTAKRKNVNDTSARFATSWKILISLSRVIFHYMLVERLEGFRIILTCALSPP